MLSGGGVVGNYQTNDIVSKIILGIQHGPYSKIRAAPHNRLNWQAKHSLGTGKGPRTLSLTKASGLRAISIAQSGL
jgi:hypothetical protein